MYLGRLHHQPAVRGNICLLLPPNQTFSFYSHRKNRGEEGRGGERKIDVGTETEHTHTHTHTRLLVALQRREASKALLTLPARLFFIVVLDLPNHQR